MSGKDESIGTLPKHFEPKLIAFLMVTVGVAETVGGVGFGRMADRFGATVVAVVGCGLPHFVAFVLVYINFVSSECCVPAALDVDLL